MARGSSNEYTQRLTLVMTHQCNFDCRYCLQKHEDVHMPRETAEKAIDFLVAGLRKTPGKAQISFYGGEPLLARKEIEYLVRYARSRVSEIPGAGIVFEITTNGTLLDESFISFAKRNKILLALSHDGVAQDLVRVDRGGNPTKAVVDQKLEMLLKTFPKTIVMMTVHPEQAGKVAESVAFFREKGVQSVSLVPAHGERVEWTEEKFRELAEELTKVKALYVKWNQGQDVFRFLPFDNKIRNYILGKDADNKMCHFGGHKLMVDVDGKYYPCSHFIGRDGFCIGSVDGKVDKKKVATLESQRVEVKTCRSCELRARCRHTCACANHGHTGSMSEVSSLQCEYEKLVIRLADEAAGELIREENTAFVERMYR